jgi:integrase
MHHVDLSAGDGLVSDGTGKTGSSAPSFEGGFSLASTIPDGPELRQHKVASALPAIPMRHGAITLAALIELYMAHYAGRDSTRVQRLSWWSVKLGSVTLQEVCDDHVHAALESLAEQPATYYAGQDAVGKPIYKSKRKALAPATLNRYAASIAAVFTWAIKRRIAPKGWVHPCRSVERRTENNEKVRFLSDDERCRLLEACKRSPWPRLYLLVMLALTTGARKGELLSLRWEDLDLERGLAHCGRTKNGDAKALPLTPAVIELLKPLAGALGGLVFASGRCPSAAYAFESRWAQALREAKVRNFRFHDLRHSCASLLAQSGATLLEIGDVLGHRQLAMTKRYSHLTTGHKAALVNRVLGDIR